MERVLYHVSWGLLYQLQSICQTVLKRLLKVFISDRDFSCCITTNTLEMLINRVSCQITKLIAQNCVTKRRRNA